MSTRFTTRTGRARPERGDDLDETIDPRSPGGVSAAKPTRLSVNIARDSVEALQEIAAGKAITMTEAVRRLIGYGIIVYRANRDGHEILIRRTGKLEKIVLVD